MGADDGAPIRVDLRINNKGGMYFRNQQQGSLSSEDNNSVPRMMVLVLQYWPAGHFAAEGGGSGGGSGGGGGGACACIAVRKRRCSCSSLVGRLLAGQQQGLLKEFTAAEGAQGSLCYVPRVLQRMRPCLLAGRAL